MRFWAAPQQTFSARVAAVMVGVAVVYFAMAKLGLALAVQAPQISAVWPATGLAIAAAYRFGPYALPAIFLGALVANATADEPLWVAAGIGTGNTLEAWLGAYIIARLVAHTAASMVRAAVAVMVAAVVAPIVSATVGVTFLISGGMQPPVRFLDLWRVWWVGDALGALVLTPALIFLNGRLARGRHATEFGPLLVLAAGVCAIVFYQPSQFPFTEYIVFPFMIYAAMRLSVSATAVIVALCDGIAISATYYGFGPFAGFGPERGLVHLQSFIAVAAVTGLLLAAVAEQQRQSEEALREADRRKDEFLAMLAHELRNPLAAISNAAELLGAGKANEERISYARGIIRRQARHLARLLDDLLDVGRVITGKIFLRKDVIDLAESVSSAIATVLSARGTSSHEVSVDCESVYIEADRTRIEQVVINLVSNALTYTPAGGTVQINVHRDRNDAVFTVRDSGIGLSPEDLEHIFDLFYQAKREVHGKRGLGIGLTLVQRMVELHDGTVQVSSEGLGKGAQFTIRLPAITRPRVELRIESKARPSREMRSVLIVEDDEDSRVGLRMLLQAEGYDVHEAADGRSGLERALRLQPDAALIDIGLPQMDGYEVARALRQQRCRSFLVALSGYGQPDDKRRAREAGFDAHLTKPADIDQLRELIATAQMHT